MDRFSFMRDRRAFLSRLIVAEVLARPGKGPLAPRFVRMKGNVVAPEAEGLPLEAQKREEGET